MKAGRPEVAGNLIFGLAVALAAVHTAMDAFVLPEPGTHWSDHLLAGSVSLAILASAVFAYPRLRDGGRAASSLVLGVLMLEGAALAVADAREGGPRGDDWTGFVLAPAGILICVLGVRLLWLSRRRTGHRFRRRTLLAVVAALMTYWVVVPTAVALMATHRPREATASIDLGRPSTHVRVRTSDGLDLNGQYVDSRNGAAVIVYPRSASRAPQARMLVQHGYGVLMLDMRGYAASEGDPNMYGWGAARDIDAGIAYLRERARRTRRPDRADSASPSAAS